MRDSENVVMCMPKRRHLRSLARKSTSAVAAKRRRCQEDAQQTDSRLALARLVHSLASNLQVSLWRKRRLAMHRLRVCSAGISSRNVPGGDATRLHLQLSMFFW